jgi:hypothetical protein
LQASMRAGGDVVWGKFRTDLGRGKGGFCGRGDGDDTLKEIVESDLVFLLVLVVQLYSQTKPNCASSGTSYLKREQQWNREQ